MAVGASKHASKVGKDAGAEGKGGEGGTDDDCLQSVPGIGPKNEEKLKAQGVRSVRELDRVWAEECHREVAAMLDFLRDSVGIRNKRYSRLIVDHLRVEDEVLFSGPDFDRKGDDLTFCVEGNISVGKTTFLRKVMASYVELKEMVQVVPEPLEKWQDMPGPRGEDQSFNILDAFYKNPERYAYTFQNYVFVTRLQQERESRARDKSLRLMERSVFSDRMVFVRAVHEACFMNDMELSVYDSWFNPIISALPGLVPDGFIYLRAQPETCKHRMEGRGRAEETEGGVSLDYLHNLHGKHEEWLNKAMWERPTAGDSRRDVLFPGAAAGGHNGVAFKDMPGQQHGTGGFSALDSGLVVPEALREQIYHLEGAHQHPTVQGVPALVLDCDPDIDLDKDEAAKQALAAQVHAFYDYVRQTRKASRLAKVSPGDAKQLQAEQAQTARMLNTLSPEQIFQRINMKQGKDGLLL